jgi:hypothetical protein
LNKLPATLPDSLHELYCSNNQLPNILPWGLEIFGMVYLPGTTFSKLEYINTKRKILGLKEVTQIPNKEEWDEINIKFLNLEKEFISETSA